MQLVYIQYVHENKTMECCRKQKKQQIAEPKNLNNFFCISLNPI